MAKKRIVEYVQVDGITQEVSATRAGAFSEHVLRDSEGHLLGYIEKDTDRPRSREWVVEDVTFKEIGSGYPTLRDAVSRAGKRLIEMGA